MESWPLARVMETFTFRRVLTRGLRRRLACGGSGQSWCASSRVDPRTWAEALRVRRARIPQSDGAAGDPQCPARSRSHQSPCGPASRASPRLPSPGTRGPSPLAEDENAGANPL